MKFLLFFLISSFFNVNVYAKPLDNLIFEFVTVDSERCNFYLERPIILNLNEDGLGEAKSEFEILQGPKIIQGWYKVEFTASKDFHEGKEILKVAIVSNKFDSAINDYKKIGSDINFIKKDDFYLMSRTYLNEDLGIEFRLGKKDYFQKPK